MKRALAAALALAAGARLAAADDARCKRHDTWATLEAGCGHEAKPRPPVHHFGTWADGAPLGLDLGGVVRVFDEGPTTRAAALARAAVSVGFAHYGFVAVELAGGEAFAVTVSPTCCGSSELYVADAVAGVRATSGPVTLAAGVAAGAQIKPSISSGTMATPASAGGIVEARARLDLWFTPRVSIAVDAAKDLQAGDAFSLAMLVAFHTNAFGD